MNKKKRQIGDYWPTVHGGALINAIHPYPKSGREHRYCKYKKDQTFKRYLMDRDDVPF